MQQKRILKLIVDGAKILELYRQNLRMVPHDIQPACQEMMVKMSDESTSIETEIKKKSRGNESDFNSVVQKTKQHGWIRSID